MCASETIFGKFELWVRALPTPLGPVSKASTWFSWQPSLEMVSRLVSGRRFFLCMFDVKGTACDTQSFSFAPVQEVSNRVHGASKWLSSAGGDGACRLRECFGLGWVVDPRHCFDPNVARYWLC